MKFDFLSESDQAYYIHKASTLVEALPYIREHAGKTIVIKYGGHAMGDLKLSKSFSKDIGLRITDKETFKIVEEVLTNEINNNIVNDINETGGKAIGLAGNKDHLIEASQLKIQIKKTDSNIEKILDIGFVGQPNKINSDILINHLKNGHIPVIAPLGIDSNNNNYNINADTVAGFIAGELKASKLLLLTDVAGILNAENNLISSLSLQESKEILNKDFIEGGMKPKILTCIKAMEKGVIKSTILDGRIPHSLILELFTEHGIGTQIYS